MMILLLIALLSPSCLCDYVDNSYDYSNFSSLYQENEIDKSAYTVYPLKAQDQIQSQLENFANSVNIFQSFDSVFNSFGERSFNLVSGNLVYNNIVKSSMVVKVIVLLISQVFIIG